MNSTHLFHLSTNVRMEVEENRLARFTPQQGGGGAISPTLPSGDCDPGRAASCAPKIIGASSRCPCMSCGGIAFYQ
jgi:hypothetical protein